MANGLPELNTNYGPDLAKVLTTAAAIKQAETQNALANMKLQDQVQTRNVLSSAFGGNGSTGTDATGSGAYQNAANALLRQGNVEGAKNVAAIGSAFNKSDPEGKLKQIETAQKVIDFGLKGLPYTTLDNYPEYRRNLLGMMGAQSHPMLPDPSVFSGHEDPQKDFNDWKGWAQKQALTIKDQIDLNTPKIDTVQMGESNQPVAVFKGRGMEGIQAIPGTGGPRSENIGGRADAEYQNLVKLEKLGQELTPEQRASKEAYETRKTVGSTGGIQPFDSWEDKDKAGSFERYFKLGEKPTFANRDARSKNAFEREYNAWMSANSLSPEDSAVARAGIRGGTMAVGENEKRLALTRGFVNTIDSNIEMIRDMRQKYGQNFGKLVNQAANNLKQGIMGSGDLAALQLALRSTSNEVAKIESGSLGIAEVSVEQAAQMKKIFSENLNDSDLMAVLDTAGSLGKIRLKSLEDTISSTKSRMGGASAGTSAKPRIDPEAAKAELRRRGLLK
jgi:hypothetical protein